MPYNPMPLPMDPACAYNPVANQFQRDEATRKQHVPEHVKQAAVQAQAQHETEAAKSEEDTGRARTGAHYEVPRGVERFDPNQVQYHRTEY